MPLLNKDKFQDDEELCRVLAAIQLSSQPKAEEEANSQCPPPSPIACPCPPPRHVIVDDRDGYSSLEHTPGIEFWVPNNAVTNTSSKLWLPGAPLIYLTYPQAPVPTQQLYLLLI
jgi:hypothetical protein